jgi:hypothetical protein
MPSPTNNFSNNFLSATPAPKHHYWLAVIGVLTWLILVGVLLYNRQSIIDWFRLLGYVPPNAVITLANDDTMTPYTRHLFYLNRPQLLTSVTSFRLHCPEDENTIVLGCYHPDQDGIFIYAVTDPTLYGVQQVTAAHEVLHAVYARLTSAQRTQLDNELVAYDRHGLTSPLVKAEVKLYEKTEPNSVYDEMSCTFGTEIADLPAGLNNYYKKYFYNRQAIVAYENHYQGEFASRENIIASDDTQLMSWKADINSLEALLKTLLMSLNAQSASLNGLRISGNIAAYNQGVSTYNSAVDSYNEKVKQIQALISQYNQLVDSRNQVAGQLSVLAGALDTRITETTKPLTP